MNRKSLIRLFVITSSSATLGGCFTTRDEEDTGVFGGQEEGSGDVGDSAADGPMGGSEDADGDGDGEDGEQTGCGNGVVDGAEQCDDGNTNDEDGCLSNCVMNVCGDGIVNAGVEECDDGNTSNEDGCLVECVANICGDGFVNADAEECDDGNTVQTDSCPVNCQWNVCGDGFIWVGVEECDDGMANATDAACLADCVANICGDGNPCTSANCISGPNDGPEQCDDGNTVESDDCRSSCTAAVCGDGVIQEGFEDCDTMSMGGETCNSLGFSFGTLACAGGCTHDSSQCLSFTGGYCETDDNCYYYAYGGYGGYGGSTEACVDNVCVNSGYDGYGYGY